MAESNTKTASEPANKPATKPRKAASASNAILFALFAIGGLVALNIILVRVPARLDMTEAQIYTLSDESKKLVSELPDYLNVKAFLSEDLPDQLAPISRYVRDLVDEYANSSNGKLRWEAVDPADDEEAKAEAAGCGVQPLQIQVLEEDKFQVGTFYMGICLQFGETSEGIAQVAQQEGFEYRMSSLIKKLVHGRSKITFATGHGELTPDQGLQSLKQSLEAEYEVLSVNPSTDAIDPESEALIIVGTKQPFDDKGLKEINKFLMTGKGGVFLVDGTILTTPGNNQFQMPGQMPQIQISQANTHGLGPLLSSYGFEISEPFVFEPELMAPGPVQFGGQIRLANMPYFPVAEVPENPDLEIFGSINSLFLPYPTSMTLTGPLADGAPEGSKLWSLATSTDQAWRHTGFFTPQPTQPPEPSGERGPFTYGYAFEGSLPSAFPDDEGANGAGSKSSGRARLFVMASSNFVSDEYIRLGQHPLLMSYDLGRHVLFNSISWAVEDKTLAPLRQKSITARPLKITEDTPVTLLKLLNTLLWPGLFCALGLALYLARRSSRRNMQL